MPRRTIQTGPDFVSGETTGVSATIDGRLFLANVNLLPDPTFSKFAPGGGLEGYDAPNFPKELRAWNAYVAAPSAPATYVLVGQKLPTSRAAYRFAGSVGSGSLVTSSLQRPDLAAPDAPEVSALVLADRDFADGYYHVAYALILNSVAGPETRITPPSPRTQAQITSSDGAMTVAGTFDASAVAAGMAVFGVAIYATRVLPSTVGLGSEPLHLQETVVLSSPTSFSVTLGGPWRDGEPPASTNDTYVGEYESHDPLDWFLEPISPASMDAMSLQLTWSFRTGSGWSAAQQIVPDVDYIDLPARRDVGVRVLPPYRPTGALAWRPEWRNAPSGSGGAGSWYTYYGEYLFSSSAFIYTANPTSEFVGANLMTVVQRATTDNTGAPAPTVAPTVTPIATPATVAGSYGVKVTNLYDEGLAALGQTVSQGSAASAPSVGVSASVATDGGLLIRRPPMGSLIPNPEFRELDKLAAPIDWVPLTGVTDLEVTFDEGVASCVDDTDSTTARDVLVSGEAALSNATGPFVLRCKFTVTAQTGGTVSLVARQVDAVGDTLSESTLHTTTTGTDLPLTEFAFGPTGADFGLDADVAAIQLVVNHADDASVGANATWELSHVGLFEGWAAPLKRVADNQGLAADAEDEGTPYPAGGYIAIVEDPEDRHADLDGTTTNMLEYYAPYSTELEVGRPLAGLKMPVAPAQAYTISVYAEVVGVSEDTELIRSVFKDAAGKIIQTNEPLAEFSGSGARYTAWARYEASYTPPADAMYIEFTGNTLGAGRVRLMGFQMEKGSTATDFDPGSLPEDGTGTAVITMDVGVDDVPNPVRNLSDVGRVNGFEMVGHSDDGEIGYELRSAASLAGPWSDWETDVADLDIDRIQRYVQVRFTLSE